MLRGVAGLLQPINHHRVPAVLQQLEATVQLNIERVISSQLQVPQEDRNLSV